jgi:hypothetical protein
MYLDDDDPEVAAFMIPPDEAKRLRLSQLHV